jgi:AraC-like DNA-binding protein
MPTVVQWIKVPCDHELRQVHMRQVNLVCITHGHKDIWHRNEWQRHKPGQLLLFAAQTQWRLHNHPDSSGTYVAQVLAVPDACLQKFHQQHPDPPAQRQSDLKTVTLTGELQKAWQRVNAPEMADASVALTQHRVMELLLILAESGHTFESADDRLLQNQIHALIHQNPEKSWNVSNLAERFHMSSSTLLRRLRVEGTSASQCVREARLERALNLLQTTRQPIGHIAETCGYSSHSRFSSAFEQQFGILPIKLRQQIQPGKIQQAKKTPMQSMIGV